MVKRRSLSAYFKKWCFFTFFCYYCNFSDKLLLFTTFEYSYDQNPSFFVWKYSWTFQNWKIFQIEAKLRPTALFQILTKKIKKLVFCLFFAIFCKIFIFFRNFFFFQFFFEKFISFYFLDFLFDFGANTLKMSKFCYTFHKNLKQRNSLSFSHQNKQISILVYFFRFSKKIQLDFLFWTTNFWNFSKNINVGSKCMRKWKCLVRKPFFAEIQQKTRGGVRLPATKSPTFGKNAGQFWRKHSNILKAIKTF